MKRVLFTAGALLLASCSSKGEDTPLTRYHDDGRAKPVVAIAPMLDTTSFEVPWSVSEELTASLVQKVTKKQQLFVQSGEEYAIADNPFSQDLAWMQREFSSNEFAVFLELVEHEMIPAEKTSGPVFPQEVSQNLNISVRVRVIDLRGTSPKIVLQEVVRDSYYIPKTLSPTDYSVTTWGSEDFAKSSMGIAHAQVIQEIASRVTEYVLLAKSR